MGDPVEATQRSRRARGSTPQEQLCEFGGLQIGHDADVLTPRAWTVMQSEWAVELSDHLPDGQVLELCCGVGHIGLVVARRTGRPLVQVDASDAACAHAHRNASRAGLGSVVEVRRSDLSHALRPGERFPLVLADPPYVPSAEVDRFPEDPRSAIDGGPDGLEPARRCVAAASQALAEDGAVLLQLRDRGQAEAAVRDSALVLAEVRTAGADRAVALLRRGRPR